MDSRWIGVLGAVAMVTSAHAQIYFDRGQTILVPSSSIPRRGGVHTHLLWNLSPTPVTHAPEEGLVRPMVVSIPGYYPNDIRTAYEIPAGSGSGAIAIVDAQNCPTVLADFNVFSNQFGLPTETSSVATASTNKVFQVVYASGTKPADDQGWAQEISLDVQWAHAIAPNAKIFLVEAASANDSDIYQAIAVAKNLPGVKQISMSFGEDETKTIFSNDSAYVKSGITFFASSGDYVNYQEYPAISPNVVGVGGTSLRLNKGVVTSEVVWADGTGGGTGGGPSQFSPRPTFQNGVSSVVGLKRGCPDISGPADPNYGVAVYSSYGLGGWAELGGTSLACPVEAAFANVRGALSSGSVAENTRNYGNLGTSGFRDITSGKAGNYQALVGYDFATGCGSPVGLLPNTQANPNAISVAYGTNTGGSLSNLFKEDGVSYNTLSKPYNATVGEYAADYVLVHFASAPSAYSKIYFYITLSATTTTTTEIWGYNYGTGVYSSWGSVATGTTPQTKILLLNPGPAVNYFDSLHTVHLYLKSHTPGNNVTAHTLKLDRVVGFGLPIGL